jgi:cysteine-rich repeat protein
MQGDLFGEGVVIRARIARWMVLCGVVIAATATGCTESSSDEQDLAQDTGSADTRGHDSSQRLDSDGGQPDARVDAPDSTVCADASCGCAKTLESGEVAYEVCGAETFCCPQAVDGLFLGCIDPAIDRRCGGCGQTRCVGSELCCWRADIGSLSCIDPTDDINNCGGCAQREGSDPINPMFSCGSGQRCQRNADYDESMPPEGQLGCGVFIGECVYECPSAHVWCPGGVNPETSLPYALDDQFCINPLIDIDFCGAISQSGATETTGQCSAQSPQTFGELKNFAGVRCGANEVCRLKLRCDHPEPPPGTDAAGQPCSPQTHYYYDVAADPAGFPDAQALPDDSVFIPDDTTRGAYIENPYLQAVCDTSCRASLVRCAGSSGAPFCADPTRHSTYCGASLTGNCEDNTSTGGADDDGVDCNRELPNTVSAQCVGGACVNPVCALGFADCDGDPSNGCETDITTDPAHCGRCSTASVDASCDTDLAHVTAAQCQAGQCIVACAPGFSNCEGAQACAPTLTSCSGAATVDLLTQTARSGCETDLSTDVNHCGACGNACATTSNHVTAAVCTAGACVATACEPDRIANNTVTPGFADCDADPTTCEARAHHPTRCNATNLCAGPSTAATTTLTADRAFPTDPSEYIDCTDPAGFGADPASTWACARNASNTAYECQRAPCGIGFDACDAAQPDVCFDLSLPDHCSACGNACGAGALCSGSFEGDCFCADTSGERCRQTGPHYSGAACAGASCILTCDPGFADCDASSANGCEVDLSSPSSRHCGGCSTDATGAAIPNSPLNCANVNRGQSACGGDDPTSFRCMFCGDGSYDGARRTPSEACDDGNTENGDGCSSTCQVEANATCTQTLDALSVCTTSVGACGDDIIDAGEQCDAPALPSATCNNDCTVSACGDGKRNPSSEANEACDDGNADDGDGCSSTCQVESGFACSGPANGLSACGCSMCDNGFVGLGEQCDGPTPGALPTATCNVDCTFSACGDGKRNPNPDANEACDDRNLINGDGCSSTCEVETGFVCSGPPHGLSVCTSP